MDFRMLYIHARSPIHSGTGQSSGVIDLPVAREKVYNWPYLPGSSIKGVLRDACDPGTDAPAAQKKPFEDAFGAAPRAGQDQGNEGAGMLWFSDAHLLCLPVRSYYGSFAWVTCPLALLRWQRDHEMMGAPLPSLPASPASDEILLTAQDAAIGIDVQIGTGQQARQQTMVYLEDLDFSARVEPVAATVAVKIAAAVFDGAQSNWHQEFVRRFGVVSDDRFSFLAETGTDVVARIRLNPERKTAEGGALWYEEAVPAETIFSCPLVAAPRNGGSSTDHFALVQKQLGGLLQIGGDAGVGRGLIKAWLLSAPTGGTA